MQLAAEAQKRRTLEDQLRLEQQRADDVISRERQKVALAELQARQDRDQVLAVQRELEAERDKLRLMESRLQRQVSLLTEKEDQVRALEEQSHMAQTALSELRGTVSDMQNRSVDEVAMLQLRAEDAERQHANAVEAVRQLQSEIGRLSSEVDAQRHRAEEVDRDRMEALEARLVQMMQRMLEGERRRTVDDFHSRLTALADRFAARAEADRAALDQALQDQWGTFRREQAAGYEDVVEDIKTLMAAVERVSEGQQNVEQQITNSEDSILSRLSRMEHAQVQLDGKISHQATIVENLQRDVASDVRVLRDAVGQAHSVLDAKIADATEVLSRETQKEAQLSRRAAEETVSRGLSEARAELIRGRDAALEAVREELLQQVRVQSETHSQTVQHDVSDFIRREFGALKKQVEAAIKKQSETVDRMADESRWVQEESIRARVEEEDRVREQVSDLRAHVDVQLRQAVSTAVTQATEAAEARLRDVERRLRQDDTQKWSVADVRTTALHDKIGTLEKNVRALQRAISIFRDTPLFDTSGTSTSYAPTTPVVSMGQTHATGSAVSNIPLSSYSHAPSTELAERVSLLESTLRRDQAATMMALDSILSDRRTGQPSSASAVNNTPGGNNMIATPSYHNNVASSNRAKRSELRY